MSYFGEAPPQRRRLASALRGLRQSAGLSGEQLAERAGWSQAKVSRIELGQSPPVVGDVEAWARACRAPDDQRAELVELAEAVATEAVAWRRAVRQGLPRLQRDVQELETSAGTIRNFSPVLIPGLLQTPEYARRVVIAGYPDGRDDIPDAIAARMARQAILYDEGKRLEFVIAEAALRWRFGPPAVQLEQLERVTVAATRPTVAVAVLPLGLEDPVWHTHGFNLFDDRSDGEPALVHVETLTSGLTVSDPADVEGYRSTFARLQKAATVGEEASALIAGVARDLRPPLHE